MFRIAYSEVSVFHVPELAMNLLMGSLFTFDICR